MEQYKNESIHRKINFKSWSKEIYPRYLPLMKQVIISYPIVLDKETREYRCAAPIHRTPSQDEERKRRAYIDTLQKVVLKLRRRKI